MSEVSFMKSVSQTIKIICISKKTSSLDLGRNMLLKCDTPYVL